MPVCKIYSYDIFVFRGLTTGYIIIDKPVCSLFGTEPVTETTLEACTSNFLCS